MTSHRITAVDVENVKFTYRGLKVFGLGGYDETEVDDFLDDVAEQVAIDQRARDEIKTLAADSVRRGKTIGERALGLAILSVLDDYAVEPLPADRAVAS